MAAASLTAIFRVASRFSGAIELHDGELEAPTLLTQDESCLRHVFCSADGAAIEGACILGLTDRCMSLEELLAMVGGLGRQVSWRFTKRFTELHKREGGQRAVTGFGCAD